MAYTMIGTKHIVRIWGTNARVEVTVVGGMRGERGVTRWHVQDEFGLNYVMAMWDSVAIPTDL